MEPPSHPLLTPAVAWMCANSALMSVNGVDATMVHAPFSLYPTKVPFSAHFLEFQLTACLHILQFSKALFQLGHDLASPYNKLYDAVASDSEWLLSTLEG